MSFSDFIKSSPQLKSWVHWLLIPRNQARPRLWVSWLINPFIHHKGKSVIIRRRVRLDVLPFNPFSIGDHSIIEDFSTINNGVGPVTIGHHSVIGLSNVIIGPATIGNHVIIAQHVVASGLNHNYTDINKPIKEQSTTTRPILIEDECWIGANVVITSGVTIGKHAVVAAGSVVTKDVPPFSVVAGNPAKLIRQYSPDHQDWIRV